MITWNEFLLHKRRTKEVELPTGRCRALHKGHKIWIDKDEKAKTPKGKYVVQTHVGQVIQPQLTDKEPSVDLAKKWIDAGYPLRKGGVDLDHEQLDKMPKHL